MHFVMRVENQGVSPKRNGPQNRAVGVSEGHFENGHAESGAVLTGGISATNVPKSISTQDLKKVKRVGVVTKVYEEVVVLDAVILVGAVSENARGGS